jgi:hypothetical protein
MLPLGWPFLAPVNDLAPRAAQKTIPIAQGRVSRNSASRFQAGAANERQSER